MTYCLGQTAKPYHAGGRTHSGLELRQLFTSLSNQARHATEIQQKAREVDVTRLIPLIRGA